MEDACRSIPTLPSHLNCSIVAITDPDTQSTRFAIFHAWLFGQSPAVNGFNKVAEFMAGLLVRIMAILG